ncbi:MAG: hypothetical protein JXB14_04545 [Candidatus Altiarchaeota archaeon]|nr:hypothetical protein [Candidatus Altiarchaeota archaeon]
MKVLITTGPTREYIDDIRFITNASSGKMGIALAKEAVGRGYDTTLVHGPISVDLPHQSHNIPVITADEMISKTLKELASRDFKIMISAAALADFSPTRVGGKIKSGKKMTLELEPTRKLLDEVRKRSPKLIVVGFKAESGVSTEQLIKAAKDRLFYGKMDMIVANDVSKNEFGSEDNEVWIVSKKETKHLRRKPKQEIAKDIWDEIESVFHGIP